MQLSEIQKLSLETARELKETAVRHEGGRCDIHPQLVVYRGNDPVAMVFLKDHIRDEILRVFRLCAWGFAADSISSLFETYMAGYGEGASREAAVQGLNPRTGKPWGEGGMQREAELFDGVEKGLVTEAIAVTTVNRAGDAAFGTMPFRYDGDRLVWDELANSNSTADGSGGRVSGAMIRQMTRAMNAAPIETVERQLALRTTIHARDVWCARFLMENVECQVVLVSTDDPERIATIAQAGEPLL